MCHQRLFGLTLVELPFTFALTAMPTGSAALIELASPAE